MNNNFTPGMTITIDLRMCQLYGYAESFIIARIKEEVFRNYTRGLYFYDGYYWTRFSIESLSGYVPHCSYATIQRKLAKLKELGVVKCERGNLIDKSISGTDYLYTLTDNSFIGDKKHKSTYQIDNHFQSTYQNDNYFLGKRERKEKEKNQKKENNKENIYYNCYTSSFSVKEKENDIPKGISQDKKKNCGSDEPCLDESRRCIIDDVVRFLNDTTGKHFRSNTASTQRHINARITDGYTLDDFKRVIVYKAQQWGNDAKMKEYLRPETLFGTKFEGYLNSVPDDLQIVEKVEKTAEELEIEKILEGYQ